MKWVEVTRLGYKSREWFCTRSDIYGSSKMSTDGQNFLEAPRHPETWSGDPDDWKVKKRKLKERNFLVGLFIDGVGYVCRRASNATRTLLEFFYPAGLLHPSELRGVELSSNDRNCVIYGGYTVKVLFTVFHKVSHEFRVFLPELPCISTSFDVFPHFGNVSLNS